MIKIILALLLIFSTLLFSDSPTRIMLLGDSITYDDAYRDHPNLSPNETPRPSSLRHGFRNHLWYSLQDENYYVRFVGSRVAGEDIVPTFDPHNEGYPGWTSKQIANITYQRMIDYTPDIVLLHIGSNDWDNSVSNVNKILNEIEKYEQTFKHHVKVLLALIINRRSHYDWISQFNQNLKNLAHQRIASGDDIVIVDMEHGANIYYDNRNFQDRTHPNDAGYSKMANLWFQTLKNILPSPPVPDPLLQHFVERFYRTILQREGEETGIEYWTDKLNSHTFTAADLARGFLDSDEFKRQENDDETFLTILYHAFFNRDPDTNGYTYWLEKLSEDTTYFTVINGFLRSSEFYALSGEYHITAVDSKELFIDRLYTYVLERDADKKGFFNWFNALKTYHTNASKLTESFFFSQEFIQRDTDDEHYITLLYRTILNREPDTEGLQYWIDQLSFKSRKEILNNFIQSKEFKSLAKFYDIDL